MIAKDLSLQLFFSPRSFEEAASKDVYSTGLEEDRSMFVVFAN